MRSTLTLHTFNTEGSVRTAYVGRYTREAPEFL